MDKCLRGDSCEFMHGLHMLKLETQDYLSATDTVGISSYSVLDSELRKQTI